MAGAWLFSWAQWGVDGGMLAMGLGLILLSWERWREDRRLSRLPVAPFLKELSRLMEEGKSEKALRVCQVALPAAAAQVAALAWGPSQGGQFPSERASRLRVQWTGSCRRHGGVLGSMAFASLLLGVLGGLLSFADGLRWVGSLGNAAPFGALLQVGAVALDRVALGMLLSVLAVLLQGLAAFRADALEAGLLLAQEWACEAAERISAQPPGEAVGGWAPRGPSFSPPRGPAS